MSAHQLMHSWPEISTCLVHVDRARKEKEECKENNQVDMKNPTAMDCEPASPPGWFSALAGGHVKSTTSPRLSLLVLFTMH